MRRFRLRLYCLLSLLVHALCLWLFRFLPASMPTARPPVAIRLLETPPSLRAKPTPAPERQRPLPPARAQLPPPPTPPPPPLPPAPAPVTKPEPPAPPKQGGIVAEIPKPLRQERPDKARILSEYDSKAQDGTGGAPGARKPSGERPPDLPAQLPLPERYSRKGPKQELPGTPPLEAAPKPVPSPEPKASAKASPPAPPKAQGQPSAQTPKPPPAPQKASAPERTVAKEQRLAESREGPIPIPERAAERDKRSVAKPADSPPAPSRPSRDNAVTATSPAERHFTLTAQQEVAMLQRQQLSTAQKNKDTLEEHFARLEQRLPLFSFDAPGTYAKGPERPGEGQGQSGGGKYRSLDAYGIKHFSYLMQLKRKIEMVFSVPPLAANRGKVGIPIVGFTVRRNGELAETVVLHSSGYPEFDQAVVRAIRRAAPYYPFPEHLSEPEISIQVYVTLS